MEKIVRDRTEIRYDLFAKSVGIEPLWKEQEIISENREVNIKGVKMSLNKDNNIYGCLKNGRHLKSQVNSNEYFLTGKKIIAIDGDGMVIKKISLPVTKDFVTNERMKGFYDMYYDDNELLVVISMRDYYDKKAVLNEELLELGELTPYK